MKEGHLPHLAGGHQGSRPTCDSPRTSSQREGERDITATMAGPLLKVLIQKPSWQNLSVSFALSLRPSLEVCLFLSLSRVTPSVFLHLFIMCLPLPDISGRLFPTLSPSDPTHLLAIPGSINIY